MSFDSRVAIYIAVSIITLFAFSVGGKAQLPEQQPQEKNPETEIEPTPLPGTEISPAPQFPGEEPVGKVIPENATVSPPNVGGVGRPSHFPVYLSLGVDTGYDDNVTLQQSGKGSSFVGENVVLSYDRPGERTQLSLLGVGRFSQYFDVSGENETSGNVTMSLAHNFSSRLSFYANIYATYQNEPNLRSNVGPENVRAPFFETVDIFALTYHWLLRFSTVTNYTFERLEYLSSSTGTSASSSTANSQNRVQNTFSEQFQFSLTSRTNLVGEYRFEMINYDTASIDSITHYALAGVDHHFTEQLTFHARAGELFRSLENDGNMTSPYFESSLYYVSSNHSLNWTTSYGVEAPTVAGTTTTKTWRTGLDLTYDLTSRLSSKAGVYYHHDDNTGGTGSTGSQDSLDLSLGLRYTFNPRFALHVDYNHSTVSGSTPYSRNRYFAGLTFNY